MKKLIVGSLAVFALFWGSPPAQADIFSVAADVPVNYAFDDGSRVKEVEGTKISVSFPFLIGLGYEEYDVTQTLSGIDPVTGVQGSGNFISTISMLDIFFTLPVPVVNIVLGLGAGTAKFTGPNSQFLKSADLSQYYVSVGIPFAAILDIHLGYHVLSGKAESLSQSNPAVANKVMDGNMTSIGLKIGF